MTPKQIAREAIQELNKKLTDEIFLLIQSNRKLMYEYLKAVEEKGLDTVNQQIGKEIKSAYKLSNAADRANNPTSTLIQSHQKFRNE